MNKTILKHSTISAILGGKLDYKISPPHKFWIKKKDPVNELFRLIQFHIVQKHEIYTLA